MEGDAGDDGAGDQEGEEGQGGALGGEGGAEAKDRVSAELIGGAGLKGQADLEASFKSFDKNGDAKLTRVEFVGPPAKWKRL